MFYRPSHLSNEEKDSLISRLWQKDPSLWTDDPELHGQVSNRLGWLDCLPRMREAQDEIEGFVRKVQERGIERVVLLGMGGSSLCPLVLSTIFGSREGYPRLEVLDTTDPAEIEKVAAEGGWEKTLFLMASKSGSTIEPNAQFSYFWSRISREVADPGAHFVAITDPATSLERLAQDRGFLQIFRNPRDIGGRYAALSYFGLVPAALIGLDIDRMLSTAEDMVSRCGPEVSCTDNPGWLFAEFLSEYSAQSRDKVTILADDSVKPFGLWVEQLVAESTGKDTRGIVPIVGETTGIPGFYGSERIFVYIRLSGTPVEQSLEGFVRELRQADFPVYELWIEDFYDLAGQFFLWEMATALVSHFLAVNAFDEPDVRLAKEKTNEVLDVYRAEGKMPVKFWVDPSSSIQFRTSEILASSMKGLSRAIRDLFQALPTWGYLGFLPYLPYDPVIEEMIQDMRHMVRQERGCATVLGFGPRYLHSTGQVHKGGPYSGAFLIFTRRPEQEYSEIPNFGVSFWHLQFAQACGDFEALSEARRRVIHVHLPADYRLGLETFSKVLSRAVRL